jgi:hypothetical protein
MRNLIFVLIISLLISCDPDNKDIFNTERVKLTATLSDTTEILLLGDTLKISLPLPDTITNSQTFIVQSLQRGQFYMSISKIDTINKKPILITPPNYWVTKGNISSTNFLSFEMSKTNKPYGIEIHFKPPSKGLYYLEMTSQPGQLKINNSYEARLFINFNAQNKHFHLAEPFFGQSWVYEVQQIVNEGLGVYVFRVN